MHVTTVPESLAFLAGQAGYMRARGFEVHAVSSSGETLQSFGRRERVTTYAVDMPRRVSPGHDLRSLSEMRAVIRSVKPHIVHAHTPKGGLLGTLAARLERVPVRIYHIHGIPFVTAAGMRRALLLSSEWCSCHAATQVLCVSRSVRELVVRKRLCPGCKVKVLCGGSINGVDSDGRFSPERAGAEVREATRDKFRIPLAAPVVGFVGRIVRDKGLAELAEAWSVLRRDYPTLHMLIVGPFEDQDIVPGDVERLLRTDERIHLAGLDWNTPPLYAAMDLVVLPSYREGFPSVPLEAAAMTLPVVATTVPGCVDAVVDGVTGSLVPPRDAPALMAAIRRYLDDPALARGHGWAGRKRVIRDFRRESIWEALYAEYQRLLRDAGIAGQEPADTVAAGRAAGEAS